MEVHEMAAATAPSIPPPRTAHQRPCPIADLQRQALAMQAAGYSVIPLFDKLPYNPEKLPYYDVKTKARVARPCLRWDRYKRERATPDEVRQWFSVDLPLDRQPNGIGLLCGKVSGGICCLDFETVERFTRWREQVAPALYSQLCIVRTGRGYHAIFKCPTPRTGEATDVEVRGEHLYIAAVNSWHPTAHRRYQLEQGSVCTLPHLDQAEADRLIALAIPTFTLPTPVGPATPVVASPAHRLQQAHSDNLTAADVRIAFNARYDLRDLIAEYGGRLQQGRAYHCPYSAAHAHGDRNGSLLVSQSTKTERYGSYICSCYNSACPLHTGHGKVIASFDLMQIMEGLDPKQAVFTAVQRLGIAREPRPATDIPTPVVIGRPPKLTALDYRTRAAQLADGCNEHGNPQLLLSVGELAATFAISDSTARRYEKWLRERKLWDRQQIGQCQSVATVLPGVAKSRAVISPENNVFRAVKSPEKVCSQKAPDSAAQSKKTAFDEITHIACNSVSAVPAVPDPALTTQLHASPPPLDDRAMVRKALALFGFRTKGKRVPLLVDWVQAHLEIEIAPERLSMLIAEERLAVLTLAQLAKRDRFYQKRGFKREQRKIAAEYAKRGIDPAHLHQRKKTVRKDAPILQPLPLIEAPATDPPLPNPTQKMPVEASEMAQDAPKVQNLQTTTPSPEIPSSASPGAPMLRLANGWQLARNQKMRERQAAVAV